MRRKKTFFSPRSWFKAVYLSKEIHRSLIQLHHSIQTAVTLLKMSENTSKHNLNSTNNRREIMWLRKKMGVFSV